MTTFELKKFISNEKKDNTTEFTEYFEKVHL
jgi:hypothetical protein